MFIPFNNLPKAQKVTGFLVMAGIYANDRPREKHRKAFRNYSDAEHYYFEIVKNPSYEWANLVGGDYDNNFMGLFTNYRMFDRRQNLEGKVMG